MERLNGGGPVILTWPLNQGVRARRAAALAAAVLALAAGEGAAQPPAAGIQQHRELRDQAQQEVVEKVRQSQELNRPQLSPEEKGRLEAEQAQELRQERQRSDDRQRRQQQLEQATRTLPDPEQQRLMELQRQGFQREDASLPAPKPDPALPGKHPD